MSNPFSIIINIVSIVIINDKQDILTNAFFLYLFQPSSGAIIKGGKGKAKDKVKELTKAGAIIANLTAKIRALMKEATQKAGLA